MTKFAVYIFVVVERLEETIFPSYFRKLITASSTNDNEIIENKLKAAFDESLLDDSECYTENLEMECSSDTENVEQGKTNALTLIPWTAALL